jgi:hypothetical protein
LCIGVESYAQSITFVSLFRVRLGKRAAEQQAAPKSIPHYRSSWIRFSDWGSISLNARSIFVYVLEGRPKALDGRSAAVMSSLKYSYLARRDASDFTDDGTPYSMHQLLFVLFTLLLVACLCSLALFFLRRKRLAREHGSLLPTHHQSSHQRSPSISNFNYGKNDSVFVYDEKMNLIHNSSSPTSAAVPEIHITFPDEDGKAGLQQGRVVVVHVTDSGSVGMEPLKQETLPPYQKEDADRFQSLDLERIGGLKEKETSGPRFS